LRLHLLAENVEGHLSSAAFAADVGDAAMDVGHQLALDAWAATLRSPGERRGASLR